MRISYLPNNDSYTDILLECLGANEVAWMDMGIGQSSNTIEDNKARTVSILPGVYTGN